MDVNRLEQALTVAHKSARASESQMAGRALVKVLMDARIDARFVADSAADSGTPMVFVAVEHRPATGSDALAFRLERNKAKVVE